MLIFRGSKITTFHFKIFSNRIIAAEGVLVTVVAL